MSMLNRMVRTDDQRKASYEEALTSMGQRLYIRGRIQQQYNLGPSDRVCTPKPNCWSTFTSGGWLSYRTTGTSGPANGMPAFYCCEFYFLSILR